MKEVHYGGSNWHYGTRFSHTESVLDGKLSLAAHEEYVRSVVDDTKVEIVKRTDHIENTTTYYMTVDGVDVDSSDKAEFVYGEITSLLQADVSDEKAKPTKQEAQQKADDILSRAETKK